MIRTVVKLANIIILTFAVNLFISGHHHPGGGFIGGLVFVSGIVLLFLAYDIESIRKNIPVDFKVVAAVGILIAVSTGLGSLFFWRSVFNAHVWLCRFAGFWQHRNGDRCSF